MHFYGFPSLHPVTFLIVYPLEVYQLDLTWYSDINSVSITEPSELFTDIKVTSHQGLKFGLKKLSKALRFSHSLDEKQIVKIRGKGMR